LDNIEEAANDIVDDIISNDDFVDNDSALANDDLLFADFADDIGIGDGDFSSDDNKASEIERHDDVDTETSGEQEQAASKFKWYVLHTYSGYETLVKDSLEMIFKKNNVEQRLEAMAIPTEDVVEEKNGKKKVVKRRLFPCYVYIKMDYDNSLWHMITKTRGCTGFVGPQGRPFPLSDDEIKRLKLEKPKVLETNFGIGDRVRIIGGSFEGNFGVVESFNNTKGSIKLKVEAFGRATTIEVEQYQIESL